MYTQTELQQQLLRFLEVHNKTRILESNAGMLRMHIALAKNNHNKTIKDKIINFLLARVEERLLKDAPPTEEDLIIANFCIQEVGAYYQNSLKS